MHDACPLTAIAAPTGAPLTARREPFGWVVPSKGGVSATLADWPDAFACRVAPGGDRDVVQLGCGRTSSRLCNTVYSPSRDTALLFSADGLEIVPGDGAAWLVRTTGPLTVTVVQDYVKVHRNFPWFVPLDRSVFKTAPAGWCSWYYYYTEITEAEVVANTDWLAKNLKPFGCEWVQIDDGWQGRGEEFGTNRDFFTTCERDFPHGMKWIADYIRAKGMRPGLWCIPCTHSDDALFARQPDLFIRRPDGTTPGHADPQPWAWKPEKHSYADYCADWGGKYYVDPTSAAGKDYFRRLFEMICDEWGYDYVKIDNQQPTVAHYTAWRAWMADPSEPGEKIYAESIRAMKAVVGPDRFLLNCGSGWPAAGLCEGMRTGADVDVRIGWPGFQDAVRATLQWLWLNTVAFYTDPDVVCVREPLTLEHARVWAALVGVTGQLLMASDKMDTLPENRVEVLRRIFPVADIHPMELYPLPTDKRPSIFNLILNKPGVGAWNVAVVFNWGDQGKVVELDPERLGLDPGHYLFFDFYHAQLARPQGGALKLQLPAQACRVVGVFRDEGRPTFVGTNRHITQGAVDVDAVRWDPQSRTLSGVSRVVGGDPYHVRVYVPAGWQVSSPGVTSRGNLAELVIRRDRNETVAWRVEFVGRV